MKLTINHIKQTLYIGALGEGFAKFVLDTANKAIEIALAEANAEQEQPLISAEVARKLGAGNAEWRHVGGTWAVIGEVHPWFEGSQYRAINQPNVLASLPDELIAPEAKKAIGEWIDSQQPEPVEPHAELKANLVKLGGELMTREAAIAKWESKKDTCDVLVKSKFTGGEFIPVLLDKPNFHTTAESSNFEYQLRAKPLKQVSWKDVPVGVMTNRGMFLKSSFGYSQVLTNDSPFCVADVEESELELAPASEQPWIAVQDDDPHTMHSEEKWLANHGILIEVHHSEEKYRITGLVEGWVLPE